MVYAALTRTLFDDESECVVTVHEKIRAYYGGMTDEHHRYRSWEICYRYFHTLTPELISKDRNQAALQLGMYLASWGMYRGSGFLLRHAFTVHLEVVEQLFSPRFSALWEQEFGAGDRDLELVPIIVDAIDAIREAYRPFAPVAETRQASDTLVTKVILGTFGCLPACDRYFIHGFRSGGFSYSYLNGKFIERVRRFCGDNLRALREEQARIEPIGGMRYPLMKLVDMNFWQIGIELEPAEVDI